MVAKFNFLWRWSFFLNLWALSKIYLRFVCFCFKISKRNPDEVEVLFDSLFTKTCFFFGKTTLLSPKRSKNDTSVNRHQKNVTSVNQSTLLSTKRTLLSTKGHFCQRNVTYVNYFLKIDFNAHAFQKRHFCHSTGHFCFCLFLFS